jgi:UPF0176 protein
VQPQKIILFYRFTPIADPQAVLLWQRTLCEHLEIKGRILISRDGINATLGGAMTSLTSYVRRTREYPGFKDIEVTWSEGTGADFPRLRVRVRDEIVSFGAPGELVVDRDGVVGGGVRLSPQQVHELVERRDDVVFFDARNAFEARIGRFKDAVVPDVRTTRDFVGQLESGQFDYLKDRPIVTYCTGGIRCEVLTAVMKRRGFREVYQLHGGIVSYGEAFADEGLWEGSLYLFDARMNHEFSERVKVIGTCERCHGPTSRYYNCANLACRRLILLCDTCSAHNVSTNCDKTHAGATR